MKKASDNQNEDLRFFTTLYFPYIMFCFRIVYEGYDMLETSEIHVSNEKKVITCFF